MRKWIVCLLVVPLAALATLSLIRGQERATPAPPRPARPAVAPQSSRAPTSTPALDSARSSPLQRQMLLSCQRGADWLSRMNGFKGRFLHGYLPALQTAMEGDDFLHQAGAAFALARAARFTGEKRYAARATQAILVLLEETVPDSADAKVRYTALPSLAVNRLGAAGLLILAINEVPTPEQDLLEKSEQLCNYIRRQARSDGSLCCNDGTAKPADDAHAIEVHVGPALHGLMRSQKHRPAAWKVELLRKAVAYYRPWWRTHKSMAFVPYVTAACSEAYLATKQRDFADFATEMNDWLCGLQFDKIDPGHMLWFGGFMGWADGHPIEAAPQVESAYYAEGLAAACRVVRATADVARHERYTTALEHSLQFLVTLQYTEANTQHFADWYRTRLVGAFHASHQDGNLRIDYTQHAVAALIEYLEQGAH